MDSKWQKRIEEIAIEYGDEQLIEHLTNAITKLVEDVEREALESLENAWGRMDRARAILQDNIIPGASGNWGMLDTTLDRRALAESKE